MNKETSKLIWILIGVWTVVIIYLVLYNTVDSVKAFVDGIKISMQEWATSSSNVGWMLFISFLVSFLGSASIGIPIPFALILFSFGDSIYKGTLEKLGTQQAVFADPIFWSLMLGCIIMGGLGCAFGESTSWFVGRGIKEVVERKEESHKDEKDKVDESGVIHNMDGLGKVLNKNPQSIPWIIFVFALTPLPDDALFVPLGLMKYPFWKSVIPGWLGKNFTTFLYLFYPVLIGAASESMGGSVLTETLMLGISITVILILMGFDWNNLLIKLETSENKRLEKKMLKEKQKEEELQTKK